MFTQTPLLSLLRPESTISYEYSATLTLIYMIGMKKWECLYKFHNISIISSHQGYCILCCDCLPTPWQFTINTVATTTILLFTYLQYFKDCTLIVIASHQNLEKDVNDHKVPFWNWNSNTIIINILLDYINLLSYSG